MVWYYCLPTRTLCFSVVFLNSIVLHTTFIHCYCFNLSPFVLTSACHTTFMIGHPCQFCIIAKLKAELQKHAIHHQLSSKKHQQGPCVSSHSTFFCCPRALTLSFLCSCFTCYYSSWNSESQHFSSCALAFLLISLLSHPYPPLLIFFPPCTPIPSPLTVPVPYGHLVTWRGAEIHRAINRDKSLSSLPKHSQAPPQPLGAQPEAGERT